MVSYRLGIDIGGTFTDFALIDDTSGNMSVNKCLTTPHDPSEAIMNGTKALLEREIKRIILTRPAVEAGETLGFLPGDFKEKLDPYLQPLYDALRDMIQPRKLIQFMEDGFTSFWAN